MGEIGARHYTPAIVAGIMAVVFIGWPRLAALLLAGGTMLFALTYAWIVYKFQQFQKGMQQNATQEFDQWQEPNFRNVTILLRQRGEKFFE